MAETEFYLSVFDAGVEVGPGWEVDVSRFSGFRKSLMPSAAGARLAVRFEGCAIALQRGSLWQGLPIRPGVDYDHPLHPNPVRPVGTVQGQTLRLRLDGGAPRTLDLAGAPLELPLAERLPPGPHVLELVAPAPGWTAVLGFRVRRAPYGCIRGLLGAEQETYLNDLAVTLWRDGRLCDRRLARNPFTREVLLWGLDPGTYALELEALGWRTRRLEGLRVEAGRSTEFPEVRLAAEPLRRVPLATQLKRAGCLRLVKFGHMDTWNQRGAEYLAILADLANLFDPDLLLIANEVNWQYIGGALNRLRVPCLLTSGNHGLPGFGTFFGPDVQRADLGPVTIVSYNGPSTGPVPEVEAAFTAAPRAEYRILQGVESGLDPEWARRLRLNMYVCGHGYKEEHAQRASWVHLGKTFQVVDVDLATQTAHVIKVTDTGEEEQDLYPLSRESPCAPVVFSPENDGTHACVAARVTNPLAERVRDACVLFRLPPGRYSVAGGQALETPAADPDGALTLEVRLDLPPKEPVEVRVWAL